MDFLTKKSFIFEKMQKKMKKISRYTKKFFFEIFISTKRELKERSHFGYIQISWFWAKSDHFLDRPQAKTYSFSGDNKWFLANPKIKIIAIGEINTLGIIFLQYRGLRVPGHDANWSPVPAKDQEFFCTKKFLDMYPKWLRSLKKLYS